MSWKIQAQTGPFLLSLAGLACVWPAHGAANLSTRSGAQSSAAQLQAGLLP